MRTDRYRLMLVLSVVLALALGSGLVGCSKKKSSGGSGTEKTTIQNAGSDTMVNLAQAWAEAYATVAPEISVEVSGGGSGTGIAALINGTVDLANASREMRPDEIERAKQHTGETPQKFIVGYDALAVYVHKDNPLEVITIEQLADIYGEDGNTTSWSQLGVTLPGVSDDAIIRVSRQSNSGTYFYFREALLGETRDFKLGSRDMHGSKDVVELVSRTPTAIGYSGMGYATEHVKMLKIARKAGEPAYAPTMENVLNKHYPITRPLHIYSHGTPTGHVKEYLDWVLSETGQKIVAKSGYVPVPKN